MRFDLMRVSLLKRRQRDVFERWQGEVPDRETWLRTVFSERIEFRHRNIRYVFAPFPDGFDQDFIAGRIGREVVQHENAPPEAGFADSSRDAWKAVTFLLDPRHHRDGQKVALEYNPSVGKPTSLLKSLFDRLDNWDPPSPYQFRSDVISDEGSFWNFVQDHPGEITTVTFELIAPNMFGQEDELDAEMKEFQERENAATVRLTLNNPDGLKLNTRRVQATERYVNRGTGSIKASGPGGLRFNSRNDVASVVVMEEKASTGARESLRVIVGRAIDAIFKR